MANFWDSDPIVSPAGPAPKSQPMRGAMPINPAAASPVMSGAGTGEPFWLSDPLASGEADVPELSAQDRYDAALEKYRLVRFPDRDPVEFRKMMSEPSPTLIPGISMPGPLAPYGATELSQHGMFFGATDEMNAGMDAAVPWIQNLFGAGPNAGDVWNASLELEQARRDLGRELLGGWGTLAEVAGGLGTGGMAAKGAMTIGSQAPGAVQALKGLTGAAASGGAYGFGSADGSVEERLPAGGLGAATGAIVGAAAPFVAKGAAKVLGMPANAAAKKVTNTAIATAPTAAAIKAESKAGFKAAEKTGAVVDGNALNLLNHDVGQKLMDAGMLLPNGRLVGGFPKVNGALNALRQYTQHGSLTVKQAQVLRRTFQNIAKSNDGTEAAVGKMMLDELDGFFENLPVTAFSANGKAGMDAVQLWAKARNDWGRYKRTDEIEKAIRNAQYSSEGFAVGLRSQFASILKSEKRSRGFSDVELAAMDKYAKGGSLQDFLRDLSSGGSIPAAILGLIGGGPFGAAAGMIGKAGVGKAAKGALEGGARKAADAVRANVALPNGLPSPRVNVGPVIDGTFRRLAVNAANPALEDTRGGLLELLRGRRP